MTFACAESCTGGLLAREMTAPAGSSEVFWGAVVTYSNQAKEKFLGVPAVLIETYGAVSGPVAEAMVRGLVLTSRVPLGVSITGVAGPGGGTPEKPVGTVWFGLGATRGGRGSIVAVRHRFDGSRARVQSQAARWARTLARLWWDSHMALDSLRSLADNDQEPFIEASQTPLPFLPNPL